MKKSLFIIILIATLASCSMVMDCRETSTTYMEATTYPNCTPVTVNEFAQILNTDTTHYKIVFFACSGCGSEIWETFTTSQMLTQNIDTNQVRIYYLLAHTGGLKHFAKEQENINFYPKQMFYLRDSIYFTPNWDYSKDRTKQILTTLYPNASDLSKTDYIPYTFISDKENTFKKAYVVRYHHKTNEVINEGIEPLDVRVILKEGQQIENLNCNTVDTIHYKPNDIKRVNTRKEILNYLSNNAKNE
ncbi:MAG: hypothetical protein J6U94_02225 [Paludibacteraceae bacterium]|nr:hypothetical protein [Paludibacteraceae bacterium]